MPGIPQLREYAWLITGPDRDPRRWLMARLEERQDGSGIWTIELFDCQNPPEATVRTEYPDEEQARAALAEIYRLRLDDADPGRWRITKRPAE